MQGFRILDGGAGSELQDLGFHVNVSIYLRKLAWLDPPWSTGDITKNEDVKENIYF